MTDFPRDSHEVGHMKKLIGISVIVAVLLVYDIFALGESGSNIVGPTDSLGESGSNVAEGGMASSLGESGSNLIDPDYGSNINPDSGSN